MPDIWERLKKSWNVFKGEEQRRYSEGPFDYGPSLSYRPDRSRSFINSERTLIASINTTIAVDCASVDIRHVRLDDEGRYEDDIRSRLSERLQLDANIDQTSEAFKQDIFATMCEAGTVAIVPVDTSVSPLKDGGYDILSLRVGKIVQWHPRHVTVNLYNDRTGIFEDITVPKAMTGIVENPLYAVMNEPNSTLQRLIRKLNMLDSVDEQTSSGKLDMIIQLPYVIKSEARREQAEKRRKDIEVQLRDSQYGIAYTDGTERITQLNRPVENNLLKQIEYLKAELYTQLGLTPAIFDGTADEKAMLNYRNRTIKPMLRAVTKELTRKFLSKTARTQGQSIEFFSDPFDLVPVADLAEIGDKFTRNEILSSNEFRSILGRKPSKDPRADELRNKNLPVEDEQPSEPPPKGDLQNGT